MNEEKIKELLSVSFIRMIAERAGYVVTRPSQDYGDDLVVKQIGMKPKFKRFQYYMTGEHLSIQLKCTTQKQVRLKNEKFPFDLGEKNYNHLVGRYSNWKERGKTPLILVLIVTPDVKDDWLMLRENELALRAKAYWYMPGEEEDIVENKRKRRVFISQKNRVTLDFFVNMFSFFHQKEKPL